MIKQIVCVYDSKAKAFMDPIFIPNIPIAQRAFKNAANDPTTYIAQSPEDYTLFHIGNYDDETCKFEIFGTPESLGLATTYKD